MKNKFLIFLGAILILVGCQSELEQKKAELAEAKKSLVELKTTISTLEEEVAVLDTTKKSENVVLISSQKVEKVPFIHLVSFRGSVASKKNVTVGAETLGRIESIKVREGQKVVKGQVLITLDAAIIRNNIAELQTALELASTVFEKQERLWKRNIGTEIQYLEAKNNKESLERRLATANSQLNQSLVRAPFNGRIDDLPARLGEMAQPGMPLLRIVSPESMYVDADVSERFLGAFDKGDVATLKFPIQNKTFESKIVAVSDVINPENRTFSVELELTKTDFETKPNQVVVVKLTDYEVPEAVLVPSEVILADNKGKFLYIVTDEGGKTVAKKRVIEAGKTQNGKTEILEGLSTDDYYVLEGYRDLSDGINVRYANDSQEAANL